MEIGTKWGGAGTMGYIYNILIMCDKELEITYGRQT